MAITAIAEPKRYNGNGTTDTFAYDWLILESSHIKVYVDGSLESGTYTVTGVGNDAGGTVVFNSTDIPAGGTNNVVLMRDVPITQETTYPEGTKFPSSVVESDFDYRAMVEQTLSEQIGRALVLSPTSTFSDLVLPDPSALKILRWNAAGTALENASVTATLSVDSGVVLVEDYGAVGDGVTDDTAEIQAALSSGNRVIALTAGKTYIVSYASTKTVSGVAQRYCLSLPANTWLNLNGATIKMAANSNASIIINADAGTADTDNIRVYGGTLDSDYTNQGSAATGQMGNIFFHRATNCVVDNVYCKNAREYAARFLRSQGRFTNLYCNTSYGDGFSFGIEGSDTSVISNSFIDNIMAESCLGTYSGKNGNPILLTAQYTQVGKLWGKFSKGGIKIQDSTKHLNVGMITEIGNTNGSTNSGIKIQGNNAGLTVQHVNIDQINCYNCYGTGLYLYDCTDIHVGTYNGYGNCTSSGATDPADVYIKSTGTTRIRIDNIISRLCTQRTFTSESTGYFQFGKILSYNCNADHTADRAVAFTGNTGYVQIGQLMVLDDNGTSDTTNCLNLSGSGIEMHIGSLYTNLANSTATPRISAASGTELYIDHFKMGTAIQEGVVTLTNGATTTTVANDSITYFGATGVYPIITLVPWNASAAALGLMRTVPTIYSSGTGFNILMATNAGASDKVYWKVVGWTSIPGAVPA